ncbi:MAG TPA: apolipoprotein N-acyltransferase [Candidatus Omnitrophota bacterium]|nr:apolipoprotein N-acyltransferase [Candidatus Omnitrophota bacterium]
MAKNMPAFAFLKKPVFLSFLSGLLLTFSFPNFSFGFLAWLAFVPLLLAIRRAQTDFQALRCGFVTGITFFGSSMHWMTHVTFVGWLLLILMESIYFILFAWCVFLPHRVRMPRAVILVWIALSWSATEWLRSEMPVFGFGWNLLAYSQSFYLTLIQSANWAGAYGLGFLMMIVNVCAAELLSPRQKKVKGAAAAFFSVIALIFIVLFTYGQKSLADEKKPEEFLRISVLQGNIPQSVKWELIAKEKILEIYEKLTQLAATEQPDLIIWPEASFPGYFNRDLQSEKIQQLAREVQTPLLVGALEWESREEAYNSAYFLDKKGVVTQRYDKLRLVPFGEYIPLQFLFGWLTPIANALGISDFSAGKDLVVFKWARESWPFGVLICFEDVFSDLARRYADRGAVFLAVITNDAWFGKTGAPFQHLQASIFRAVENGLPVVRSANTGVSAFISYQGEVLSTVKDKQGKEIFMMGQTFVDLPLITQRTFFRQGGYLFSCMAFTLWIILGIIFWIRSGIFKKGMLL